MNFFALIIGIILLVYVTIDIVWTVLWIDGGAAPLTNIFAITMWKLFKKQRTFKFVYQITGSVILISTLIIWIMLAWVSWYLILDAFVDPIINTINNRTLNSLDTFYFVGTSLFTFGNGGFAPREGVVQLLSTLISAYGMIILSLGISYVINVMSGVVQNRKYAADITTVGSTIDEFILTLYDQDGFSDYSSYLNSLSSGLNEMASMYKAYPLICFYQSYDIRKSLAYSISMLIDSLIIIQSDITNDMDTHDLYIKQTLNASNEYCEVVLETMNVKEDIKEIQDLNVEELLNSDFPINSNNINTVIEAFNQYETLRSKAYTIRNYISTH